jgi:hypothetical protein
MDNGISDPGVRVSELIISSATATQYDLAIAVIGYESRSRFVGESVGPNARFKVAAPFDLQRVLSFEDNLGWYQSHGYEVIELNRDGWSSLYESGSLSSWVGKVDEKKPIRIFVDISSMSRHILGCVVAGIWKLSRGHHCGVAVDFAYAVADYNPPGPEMDQISSAGPILPEFAGWDLPDKPTAAIIGLGYELHRAIGLLEFLEPAQVFLFEGMSEDHRFDSDVRKANQLMDDLVPPDERLQYRINQPFETFIALESLVAGVSRDFRPVLVPFGPKVFALCCLLVAIECHPNTAVWRVSSEEAAEAVDRKAAGPLYGISAHFNHRRIL